MANTAQERLLVRLRAAGLDLPEGTVLHRIRASTNQRLQGAWSWTALTADGRELNVGSQWPMTVLVQAPRLIIGEPDRRSDGDRNIDPDPVPARRTR